MEIVEDMTTTGMQRKMMESSKETFKSRLSILKSMPEDIANEQIVMDDELSRYLKDLLEFNFHSGFAGLGALEFEEENGFKIIESDLKNKKFKFKYNGKLYASLKLLHMLSNNNRRVKENEKDIVDMINNYYIISENIPFEFDNDKNINRNESLATNVKRWTKKAEFECRDLTLTEENILNVLDEYADEAIKALVASIENTALEELKYLLGE